MGKDKSFVRVHSMDVTTLMKNGGKSDNHGQLKEVNIQTEEITVSPRPSRSHGQPSAIAPDPVVQYATIAYDVALILVPVLLIIKAVLCIVAAHKDADASGPLIDRVSSMTLNLIKFNDQLVTIFTIFFVMIMAGLARRIALWKAQRGATVGELEQFHNSTTLTGTIKMIWSLRAFSMTSVALIVAWSFYYLGSQAPPREYAYQESGKYSTFSVALQSSTGPSYFQPNSGLADVTNVQLENINAEFTQDYLAQTDKAYDRSGAALVPLFGQTMSFPPYLHQVDKDGWQHTTDYSSTVYSSLVGAIPWGPPIQIGYYTAKTMSYHLLGDYTYDTSYMVANCTSPEYVAASEFPSDVLPTIPLSFNMTKSHYIHTISARPFDLWNRYNSTIAFHSTCTLTTANVEVAVSCNSYGCTATKIRPSTKVDAISNRTPFDSDDFAYNFFNNLTLSSGIPSSQADTTVLLQASGLTSYRENFENLFEFLTTGDRVQGYAADLTQDMTQVINTYFAVSQPHATPPTPAVAAGTASDPNYATASMHGGPYLPQYALDPAWLAVDFISNAILLAAAITSLILGTRNLAPDMFGYVASNPNLNQHLPDGGNGMTGLQRARSMKNVRVKMGDLSAKDIEAGAGGGGLTFRGLNGGGGGDGDVELDRLGKAKEYSV